MEIYIHISSGSGPKECEWVVSRLAIEFIREAKSEGVEARVLSDYGQSVSPSPSLLMKISGSNTEEFINSRIGTIRWVGKSPFRPYYKRKNWFVSVKLAPQIKEIPDIKEIDIQFQTMKASGPGGQHINTSDTAVRATHTITGISVVAREERSQLRNKKLAVAKLLMTFIDQRAKEASYAKDVIWQQNNQLERGNEVRTYAGPEFKLR